MLMASPTTFNTTSNVTNGNDPKNPSANDYSVDEIGLFDREKKNSYLNKNLSLN